MIKLEYRCDNCGEFKPYLPSKHSAIVCSACKHVEPFPHPEEGRKRNLLKMHRFIAISPDGERYRVVGISPFARKHGLHVSAISNCLSGRTKSHRGWKFESQGLDTYDTFEERAAAYNITPLLPQQ